MSEEYPELCVYGGCVDPDCPYCAELDEYDSSLEDDSCDYFSDGSCKSMSCEDGSSDEWSEGPLLSDMEDHGVCCAELWPEDENK